MVNNTSTPLGVEPRARLIPAPHARRHFKRGFDTVVNALRPTLGPTGRTVLVERMDRTEPPELLNDAGTVARRIVELPLYENAGGMLARHLVWRVLDQVGDGSATSAVIAQALLREATRAIAAGAHPASLRKAIESGLQLALAALDSMARPMDGIVSLRHVALAACHDDEIADRLVAIYERYGTEIVVSVQESMANGLSVEVADGAKWDSGFASPSLVNDPDRNLAWSDAPLVLLTNVDITRAEQLTPLMERMVAAGEPELTIIAPTCSDAALAVVLANNGRGTLHTLAIIAPGLGDHRVGVLRDLAALTGGRYVNDAAGDRLEETRVGDLGQCGTVWASRDFFSVVDGDPDPQAVAEQVREVRGALEREDVPLEREQFRLRLGRLTGGVALLSVGAATKSGTAERKSRADRAVYAVEAARGGSIVPGGGAALAVCAASVTCDATGLPLDERLGRRALAVAMEEPLRVIVANAGGEPGPIVTAVKAAAGHVVYDALTRQLTEVGTTGIVDPLAVVRTALRDGVSAGVMAMMTETIVIPRYRLLHADPHP